MTHPSQSYKHSAVRQNSRVTTARSVLLLARRVRRLVKERQRFSGGQRDVEHVEYRRDGGVAPGGVSCPP